MSLLEKCYTLSSSSPRSHFPPSTVIHVKGVIELETTFGAPMHARTISVLYIVVDVDLEDRFPATRVGKLDVNELDLDLDPRCEDECKRPLPAEDLNKVSIGPKPMHMTKKGTTLAHKDESHLVAFLRENRDVFAWSSVDMPGIDPDFLCHHLLISPNYR
ncbi:hypothetical protein CR513_43003, partial [Mucuna pruriens]